MNSYCRVHLIQVDSYIKIIFSLNFNHSTKLRKMKNSEAKDSKEQKKPPRDRLLGDEWIDWDYEDDENEIREGKKTFLLISFVAITIILAGLITFWYLVLPRFESYGRGYSLALTLTIILASGAIIVWYIISIIAIYSKSNYLKFCLHPKSSIFFLLYPLSMRIARSLGISRDRLSHSFIKVSNESIVPDRQDGPVLILLPRCLKRDLKSKAREISKNYPDTIVHTAPGGSEARLIIKETKPRAIIAVACERDLVSGVHEVAPKLPVIGIPNSRPIGPCKDTTIELEELEKALKFFSEGKLG